MRTFVTRRSLGFGALGATLVGSETGVADDRPNRRQLPWTFAPVPIQGGTSGFGPSGAYHVFGGPGQENSTISNFKGSIGSALIDGNVTRINIRTGEQEYFPFKSANMRFMTGAFKGTDGQEHPGTFAFAWVDVYLPGSGGVQIHDLNPSQFPPVGLFWTVPIPVAGVQVDLEGGTASMRARKVPIFDWTTIQNAVFMGNNPPPVPGWVSFKVVWTGGAASMPVNSTDPTKGIFSGTFARASAQMEWQAAAGDFAFQSDPLETSQSTFAEIGQETNGSYLTA